MNRPVLTVLIGGEIVGEVMMTSGKLSFTYAESWGLDRPATPLSLSMPTVRRHHDDEVVRPFLWGLLPDDDRVLERWGQTYGVSPRSPFDLLQHVGEDCAGAAQFVRPDRLEAILAGDGGVNWLSEAEIGERLAQLRRDPAAWHLHNTGEFSLAGAQAKTALHYDSVADRWGEPWGAVPTTHIIKPAITSFTDHDINEHLCLRVAREIGLSAVTSRVRSFGGQRAIVVDRYDRARGRGGTITRVHQEDTCQSLAVMPHSKYQVDHGPSPETVIALLRREIRPSTVADETAWRFAEALILNWLIGGTDAHAKNYSVLLAGGQVRLAPLYDVASSIVYDEMYVPRLRLAMKIGGEYRLEYVHGRHWRRFAETNGFDSDALVASIEDLATRVPAAFEAAVAAPEVAALDSPLPALLAQRVAARAATCQAQLSR